MLFKKSNKDEGPPAWANFFTTNEYNLFLACIHNYFSDQGVKYQVDDGVAFLEEEHLGYDNFGLVNLAQICKQSPQEEWDDRIMDFFASMKRSNEIEAEFESNKTDFEFVRPFIAVRIYNIEYMDGIGREHFIFRNITDQVIGMLVFDLPDSIMNIKPENIVSWGKPVDELFTIGYENARENYPIEIEKQSFGEIELWMASADHFFSPNILLSLNHENQHLVGTHGSLVGVPHRHVVLIYAIEDLGVLDAIKALIPTIHGMNLEGPGSISHELYWFENGNFHNLPYEMKETALVFTPPEDFVEVLNGLQQPG